MEKNLDKERKYNRAKTILSSKFKTKEDYERALNLLKECPEYEDAEKLIQFCQEKINGNEKDRKNKIISLIIIVVIIFIICLIPLIVNFIK